MIDPDLTAIDVSPIPRSGSSARICETDEPEKRAQPYGIGFGEGKGDAWQTAAAQGGRGIGALMSELLPWVAAVPPLIQIPVKVLMSGYGVVKPSESVCMKATIWFSSKSLKPRFPTVMSILFGISGVGQQFTFSIVPAGQFPEVTGSGNMSRVL